MEIRKEHKNLTRERKEVQALLGSDAKQWERIAEELGSIRDKFAAAPLGTRRTALAGPPAEIEVAADAFVEREAITVILSDKGWVRAVKGAVANPDELKFKDGDRLKLLVPCETTDRLCLFATNGKAFTIKAADLPRGRGDGQPIRLVVDLTNEDDVTAMFIWREGVRHLVASTAGRGFVVKAEDLLAEKRTGKQVLNLKPGEEAGFCIAVAGDHLAVIGSNRKLLAQVPEMARGGGVMLQKYKDSALADLKTFTLAEGLTWRLGEKTRTENNLRDWLGERGQVGRLPPNGFPKSGKFS
jgi:topoisomerase-4 subunit A